MKLVFPRKIVSSTKRFLFTQTCLEYPEQRRQRRCGCQNRRTRHRVTVRDAGEQPNDPEARNGAISGQQADVELGVLYRPHGKHFGIRRLGELTGVSCHMERF